MADTVPINNSATIMRAGDIPDKGEADIQTRLSREASRRRTQQFEDQFAYKDNWETKSGSISPLDNSAPLPIKVVTNFG
jgi:hypothetical protein